MLCLCTLYFVLLIYGHEEYCIANADAFVATCTILPMSPTSTASRNNTKLTAKATQGRMHPNLQNQSTPTSASSLAILSSRVNTHAAYLPPVTPAYRQHTWPTLPPPIATDTIYEQSPASLTRHFSTRQERRQARVTARLPNLTYPCAPNQLRRFTIQSFSSVTSVPSVSSVSPAASPLMAKREQNARHATYCSHSRCPSRCLLAQTSNASKQSKAKQTCPA